MEKISAIQTETLHSLNPWTSQFFSVSYEPLVSLLLWQIYSLRRPVILLNKSIMLPQRLQSTSTIADRGISVSVTIHRDSLICAVCGSATAAKELFLFNADQKAARGCSHLHPKHHGVLVTVAGGVTMPAAWTGSVLIRMNLFFKALSLSQSI